jgi:hypothetical protein
MTKLMVVSICKLILSLACFIFLFLWFQASIETGSFEGAGIDASKEDLPGLFGLRAIEEGVLLVCLFLVILYELFNLFKLVVKYVTQHFFNSKEEREK